MHTHSYTLDNLELSALPWGTSTCGKRKLESRTQLLDCKTVIVPIEPQHVFLMWGVLGEEKMYNVLGALNYHLQDWAYVTHILGILDSCI